MSLFSVSLFLLIAIFLCTTSLPVTYASVYGGSTYDNSTYNGAATPTPTLTQNNNSNSSSNNSGSSSGSGPCTDTPPSSAPDLFQIDRVGTTATLFFAPAGSPYNNYTIVYGYAENDDRFSAGFGNSNSSGAITYTVNELSPQATYYFKVRGGYGCASGPWSNSVSIRKIGGNQKVRFYSQKQSIPTSLYNSVRNTKYTLIAPKPSLTLPPQTLPKQTQTSPATSSTTPAVSSPTKTDTSITTRIVNFFTNLFR